MSLISLSVSIKHYVSHGAADADWDSTTNSGYNVHVIRKSLFQHALTYVCMHVGTQTPSQILTASQLHLVNIGNCLFH